MLYVLLIPLIAAFWVAVAGAAGINRGYHWSRRLLGQVSQAAHSDIFSDRPWKWRYDEYERITSIWHGWQGPRCAVGDLSRFVDDWSFIDPEATGPNTSRLHQKVTK